MVSVLLSTVPRYLCFFSSHNEQKRLPVSEETHLAELCVGFYESLKPFVSGMVVAHLKGKTEKGWEELVRQESGPWKLVSGWFKEHDLRPFLDGFVEPQELKTPKRAKSEQGELVGASELLRLCC